MNKVLLIILDGWGEGKPYPGNAITLAKTPNLTALRKNYPWTLLKASGEAVGLPKGTQGGSEVGHFTIGAGRVVFQFLEEINRSIKTGRFFKEPALIEACTRVNKSGKAALHLIGMISDQGVHSHIDHLFALLKLAHEQNVKEIFIHAITDGRDVPERSAIGFTKQIQAKIKELGMEDRAFFGSIIGRFYAMDRDMNWDRVKKAYDLYASGTGVSEIDPAVAIENAYKRGIETDYYIDPIILNKHAVIKDKDSVIFWNFRTDRSRQLTWTLTGEKETPLNAKLRPFLVCLGPYSDKAKVIFHTPAIKNNLGEVISKNGLKQFRIAETDKYPHVTFFFNSEVEAPFTGEDRLFIKSPKCASYAEKPEMSAREITDEVLPKIESQKYALIVLNFANCDLVGHSGDLKATIKGVETIDECIGRIIPDALQAGYHIMLTGDHGNAEYKIYEKNGEPCPSHTLNPVPFILVGKDTENWRLRQTDAELDDIAPTILKIMGIEKPKEMTGENLLLT